MSDAECQAAEDLRQERGVNGEYGWNVVDPKVPANLQLTEGEGCSWRSVVGGRTPRALSLPLTTSHLCACLQPRGPTALCTPRLKASFSSVTA